MINQTKTEATVISHTRDEKTGRELVTILTTFPHIILPQVNKHRAINNNCSSSRAIPVKLKLAHMRKHPFVPKYVGFNQKGMQSGSDIKGLRRFIFDMLWKGSAKLSWATVKLLDKLNVHKEISNRLLEPFGYVAMVMTASPEDFQYMINLRTKKATKTGRPEAQYEIFELASCIQQALSESEAVDSRLTPHGWHIPFVSFVEQSNLSLGKSLQLSVARCARISYLRSLEKRPHRDDYKLFRTLYSSFHESTFDHQGCPIATTDDYTHTLKTGEKCSGSFKGFTQLRHSQILVSEIGGNR